MLQGMELVTNRFSGTIPTEIGKLGRVINVHMNDNRLSGTIPPEIGGMGQMLRWNLQENYLSGACNHNACPHSLSSTVPVLVPGSTCV